MSKAVALSVVLLDDETADGLTRRRTLEALREQTSTDWELRWVAPSDDVAGLLSDGELVDRPRVDTAVDRLRAGLAAASGRLVMLIEPGDMLEPEAVERFVLAAPRTGEKVLLYADERSLDHGVEDRKAAWSPERLRHHNYIGRPWAADSALIRRSETVIETTASWEHDLLLAMSEDATRIDRVPQVLLRRVRPPSPAVADDSARAVQRHLDRVGIAAAARPSAHAGIVDLERALPAAMSVAIVIPTGWGAAKHLDVTPSDKLEPLPGSTGRPLVLDAVRLLLAHTQHPSVEVVIVYDHPVPDGAFDELREIAGDRLRLVPYDKPFNFSEKCNLGALASAADVVALVNDDILPITDGWLEALVAPLAEPGVGMTGAKLRFPDRAIQSGGHRYSRTPQTPEPDEAFRLHPADDPGPGDLLLVDREVSGVTGACAAVRRDVFDEVGGLTEALSHSYNDVDFSLKVRRAGYRILWMAGCEMVHLESQTRNPQVRSWEHDILRDRWGGFTGDAYLP